MIVGLYAALGALVAMLFGAMPIGWPRMSENWRKAARVVTVISGVAFFIVLGVLIWQLSSPHTTITITKHSLLISAYVIALVIPLVGIICTVVSWNDAHPSRKPFQIHYRSSHWIETSKELTVEVSLKCTGKPTSIDGIELRIGRLHIPCTELSRPMRLPFNFSTPTSEEQTFSISLIIPNKPQETNHKNMTLCVISGDKRYSFRLPKLRLE